MHKMNPKLTLLSLVAFLLAVIGCGGGGEPSSQPETTAEPEAAAPRPDICGLLTGADIEEVLGAAPGAPTPGDDGRGHCIWPAADGSSTAVEIVLDDATIDSFDEFVTDFGEEFGGENPPRDEYHPVEGVGGDWAMYEAEDHRVRAFSGDDELEVEAPGADEAQVIDLASRAMARRP